MRELVIIPGHQCWGLRHVLQEQHCRLPDTQGRGEGNHASVIEHRDYRVEGIQSLLSTGHFRLGRCRLLVTTSPELFHAPWGIQYLD